MFLSSSYLTVSVGTISTYTVTRSGAASPMGTPCQGWEVKSRPRAGRRVRFSGFPVTVPRTA